MQSAFSNKQLDEIRQYLLKYPKGNVINHGYARCRRCTGQQTMELTCTICDHTKSTTEFSKAQRRNPDNAVSLEFLWSLIEDI